MKIVIKNLKKSNFFFLFSEFQLWLKKYNPFLNYQHFKNDIQAKAYSLQTILRIKNYDLKNQNTDNVLFNYKYRIWLCLWSWNQNCVLYVEKCPQTKFDKWFFYLNYFSNNIFHLRKNHFSHSLIGANSISSTFWHFS